MPFVASRDTADWHKASHLFDRHGSIEANYGSKALAAEYFVAWIRDGVVVHEDYYYCYQRENFFDVLEREIAEAESLDWYDEVIVGDLYDDTIILPEICYDIYAHSSAYPGEIGFGTCVNKPMYRQPDAAYATREYIGLCYFVDEITYEQFEKDCLHRTACLYVSEL